MLEENAIGTRGGRVVRQEAEVSEARDPSFISLFSLKFHRERGTQYVKVTIRSSPTASMRYTFSGNFAGRSLGWPV
jgi:hypothetical protein